MDVIVRRNKTLSNIFLVSKLKGIRRKVNKACKRRKINVTSLISYINVKNLAKTKNFFKNILPFAKKFVPSLSEIINVNIVNFKII